MTIADEVEKNKQWFMNRKAWLDEHVPQLSTGIHTIQQVESKSPVIYNLNGQRVAKAVKGLYILNGKVVAVN